MPCTTVEALAGYALGIVVGVVLAIAIALLLQIERPLMPLIVGFNSVPVVAYAPMMLIWFGMGPASKIAMASSRSGS